MKRHFSEDEIDALTELINVGVGSAAAGLSRMVRSSVALTVPAVGIVSSSQAAEMMDAWSAGPLLAVEQVFSGALLGRALLVLPREHRENLFAALTSDAASDPEALDDALRETGNVLLQGCLGTMANMLQRPLEMGTPDLIAGPPAELIAAEAHGVVILVYVSFGVHGRQIRGYVALVLDVHSVAELRSLVEEFIRKVS